MEDIFYTVLQTPWTKLFIASGRRGLLAVKFIRNGGERSALAALKKQYPEATFAASQDKNREMLKQLQAYTEGRLRAFDLPLDLKGTDFQKSVWKALGKIAYGTTRSYAEVARTIGHPRAFRAVGQACRLNPTPIVVPCHRVLAADCTLGGYGGGVSLKGKLLKHEGASHR